MGEQPDWLFLKAEAEHLEATVVGDPRDRAEKGRVSRAHRLRNIAQTLCTRDAQAPTLLRQRDEYKEALDAAWDYINKSPGDPDTYPEQWKAWQKMLRLRIAIEGATE